MPRAGDVTEILMLGFSGIMRLVNRVSQTEFGSCLPSVSGVDWIFSIVFAKYY